MDNEKRWWHTGGYIKREGDQCRIWMSCFAEDQSALVPYDPSMPDWLSDPSLDFFGDGVAFQVEIPYAFAGADDLTGITWRNWRRQPYDDATVEELADWFYEHVYEHDAPDA